LSGIYSSSPEGLFKLADTNTPVPDGMGNFTNFPRFTLSGNNVVFQGRDANQREGLYYVPATGGALTKIIAVGDGLGDGRTVVGNGTIFFQPAIQEGSLSGNELGFRVEFHDAAQGANGVGIYLAQIQSAN
jgi:hypothetical protein